MKLYIKIDYKDKEFMYGSIYNKPKNKHDEVYLRYRCERYTDNIFELTVYKVTSQSIKYQVMLDETFDCRMCAKDILFYIEQRIELLWEQL